MNVDQLQMNHQQFDPTTLIPDLELRTKITLFDVDIRDQVQHLYLEKGLRQPCGHSYQFRGEGKN